MVQVSGKQSERERPALTIRFMNSLSETIVNDLQGKKYVTLIFISHYLLLLLILFYNFTSE